MAFAAKDTKLLWGRAAGICSKPDCRRRLTATGAHEESYLTGEMAHQIAQSPVGPRGADGGGDDTYDNLILLCPSCHRTIDKAPAGTFPVDLLKEWKKSHEHWVDGLATEGTYKTAVEVAGEIERLLIENQTHFDEYGPTSGTAVGNPASTAQAIWVARKLDTLLPNNRRIVSLMEKYSELMSRSSVSSFPKFKMHTEAFEGNQYERVEKYPSFPSDFSEAIKDMLI
jgi:hypothetical protein